MQCSSSVSYLSNIKKDFFSDDTGVSDITNMDGNFEMH